jgi:hypothetical protein
VTAIIENSRNIQMIGNIGSIGYVESSSTNSEKKIFVEIIQKNRKDQKDQIGSQEVREIRADYLVTSMGQDAYEDGGLHHILSNNLRKQLVPIHDRNQMSGNADTTLGFGTPNRNFEIIGAAGSGYYDTEYDLKQGPAVSATLPGGAKVGATIGGVIASVSALTGYMPLTQDAQTGEVDVTGLNQDLMNRTQLACYFTGLFPNAKPLEINQAIEDYVTERSRTWFGFSDEKFREFLKNHFPEQPD